MKMTGNRSTKPAKQPREGTGRKPLYFLLFLAAIGLVPCLYASDYVALEEHLGAYLADSLVFTDASGQETRLLEIIDRPTVISPVYYNCPGLCTPIMNGLVKLLNTSDLALGKDFQVINISFHDNEGPDLALVKKNNYLALLEDKGGAENWHFMTGDRENIKVLLDCLGYSVIRHGKDILHPAAIMIVSPHGKIVKYIHGTSYNPVEFKMAIREAAVEKTMPTLTKLLKMCLNYEPAGREKQRRVTILGFIFMLLVAGTLFVLYPPLKNK